MLLHFTHGRTGSARELTATEAKDLIKKLSELSPVEKLKKAIWFLGRKAGIIYGDTKEDNLMNAAKIDAFLRERGTIKKPLQKMSYDELKLVHRQFEGMVINTTKTTDNKHAKNITDNLLSELNITTSN